jgi:hypothetical protein
MSEGPMEPENIFDLTTGSLTAREFTSSMKLFVI